MPHPPLDPRSVPLPATWTVREGRDAYLAENGFSTEAYDAAFTPATLFGVRFSVPNTPRHRWAIRLHDLHHVATGFGTDLAGEAEVSAWECGAGLRRLGLYTGGIVLSLALAGLVIAPRRTLRAYRASTRESLFRGDTPYDDLLSLSIAQLRERLGIPATGLGRGRKLHADAPTHPSVLAPSTRVPTEDS